MTETNTGSEMELRFAPFANVLINRHEGDDADADYCRETAAVLFVEAARVVDRWKHYARLMEKDVQREREKVRKLKEERDGLQKTVVELDQRLRDPNSRRPDPLGPSVPRGSGQQELVKGDWCPGGGKMVDGLDYPASIGCAKCGRTLSSQPGGRIPNHKYLERPY